MLRIMNRTLGLGCGLLLLCGLNGCASKAKNWTFTDAQGAVRTLSDYEGQVVVINFSNTWCDPCQEAAVHMQGIQDRFGPLGVKVITVSSWERGDPGEWMAENGFNYGVMVNGTKVAREYKVDRLPTFVVLGVNGKVIYRHEGLGKSTPQKIARVVEKHLKKHGRDGYAQHGG